jgi:hypothetical protein
MAGRVMLQPAAAVLQPALARPRPRTGDGRERRRQRRISVALFAAGKPHEAAHLMRAMLSGC